MLYVVVFYAIIEIMKLYYDKKSKNPTYFIQQGFRNGKKTSTRNVAVIGKHCDLLKITDDPLAYAKQKVAEYNEQMKNSRVSMEVTIDFDEKIKASEDLVSSSTSRNIGYFFLQAIYHELAIGSFFKTVTAGSKITFDPNLVSRFLTCARILEPESKLATLRHLNHYYEQPEIEYQHIHRTLDILEENFAEYLRHLFQYSSRIVPRDTSVCFFDCTNFYWEIESPDDDYVDEVTGEVIKGFRKYGPSMQHQPSPLVEMGLFMDSNGIPLSMCLTSGSDNEQTLAVPLEKELIKMFQGKKFIYCADAGLGSLGIRQFNSMGGRAFIVTQSIKKLSGRLQEAVFNDYDYRLLSSGAPVTINRLKEFDRHKKENLPLYLDKAYKVINADRLADLGFYEEKLCKNGRKRTVKAKGKLEQKIIVTFSRKSLEYQRFIRNRQIERAKKLLKSLDPETYKKGPNDITRLIKRTSTSKSAEQAAPSYELDLELIREEEKYDGYYAIATNLDDDPALILETASKRYQIEDCFRVLKTNFSSRPVYHHSKEHITAHFQICYTALLIYRLLEKQLEEYCIDYDRRCGINHKDPKARTHFTINNIIETLKNMNVVNVQDMYYMSAYTGSQLCTALNSIYDLGLDKKYYQPKELNKKIKKISG
mgnify:FL=1